MLQDKNDKRFSLYIGFLLTVVGAWVITRLLVQFMPEIPYIREIHTLVLFVILMTISGYILFWGISHHINKGIRYAFAHAKMVKRIRTSLLDAGYYYCKQYCNEEEVAVLPKIKVEFGKNLLDGKLYIRNNLHIQKKLEDRNISSALGKYVMEETYTTDDENWFVFEFIDASINNRLIFNSYKEFISYSKKVGNYRLFMDKRSSVPLSSLLLCGSTGSGKTYALYQLTLACLNWEIKPVIYFADPKASSLAVFGNKISPEHTAESVEDIIALLEDFYQKMEERKRQLKDKLEQKLDSDYTAYRIKPLIFCIDEVSSFLAVVNTLEKKTRDKVAMMLRSVVLQGRQIGCFLWIAMQKSDSSDIPTAIRDNLVFKIVLGNAPSTTYQTTFEESADLPKRKFGIGQGLYSYQGLTKKPQIVSFSTLNFDINEAAKEAGTGVM